ncbi:MAG TPA: DUF6491 family protein [Steroidobacteraceae bacterium]|nr:DUF6491 family protein [Steroidobacteraceae bacterium]
MQQRLAAGALTATLVAACASPGSTTNTPGAAPAGATASSAATGTPAQQQALARYEKYAGPPLDSFTWLGSFDSWEPLGKSRLAVFTTPSEAYLLTVWPSCDLRFVVGPIGISSTSRTVYRGLDSVTINTGPGGPRSCPIDEIRKIDYLRMRADMRAQPANPPQR